MGLAVVTFNLAWVKVVQGDNRQRVLLMWQVKCFRRVYREICAICKISSDKAICNLNIFGCLSSEGCIQLGVNCVFVYCVLNRNLNLFVNGFKQLVSNFTCLTIIFCYLLLKTNTKKLRLYFVNFFCFCSLDLCLESLELATGILNF